MARRRTSALDPERKGIPGAVKAAAAVVAVLAAVGAVLYVNTGGVGSFSLGPQGAGPVEGVVLPSTSSVPPEDAIVAIDPDTGGLGGAWAGRTVTFDIYMDGWSWKTMGEPAEVWAVTDVTQAVSRVAFSPVTVEQAQQAMANHPRMVEGLLGRMATLDRDVACQDGACSIAGSSVDAVSWIVDPTSIPHWGRSYAGWGIESTLYRAAVTVPEDSLTLYLKAEGWEEGYGVSIRDTSDAALDGGAALSPSSADGWKDGGYMFSAAFGLTFPTTADWVLGERAFPYERGFLPDPATLEELPAGTWSEVHLQKGLADVDSGPLVINLPASQLTYLSSPTTGCGVAVVCVPATIDATVEDVSSVTETVCDENDYVGAMTLTTAKVTATLPAPTHMTGVWGGASAAGFEGSREDGSVLGFSGYPPLAEGTVTWRQAALTLEDALGGLVSLTGSRNDTGPVGVTSLDVPNYFGGGYRVCQANLVLE